MSVTPKDYKEIEDKRLSQGQKDNIKFQKKLIQLKWCYLETAIYYHKSLGIKTVLTAEQTIRQLRHLRYSFQMT